MGVGQSGNGCGAETHGEQRDCCGAVAVVEIFVSEHCFVCDYAHEVAAVIRRDFPAVAVRVIDIHDAESTVPDVVFATPTYLLNGHVWSLGNPSPESVSETLSAFH